MKNSDLFEALVNEHYELIYKYCLVKLGRDDSAATEVTHDTFMILRSKLDTLNLTDNVAGWLVKTAQNCILKYKEREARYHSRTVFPDDESFDHIAEDGASVEERVISEIFDGELTAAINSALDDREKELFRLKYIEDKNPTEIAAILKTPYTTTRMRLKRLEAKLRHILSNGGDPSDGQAAKK